MTSLRSTGRLTLLLAFAVGASSACGSASDVSQAGAPEALTQSDTASDTAVVADSGRRRLEAALHAFQAAAGPRPDSLRDAARSREELVQRFIRALESRDAPSIERLRMTRAEFAYLFYPQSVFTKPPYELEPDVVWLQTDAESSTGLRRALREYGGKPLRYVGLQCTPPQEHGPARLWGCDVRRAGSAGDTLKTRLFGAILERDGRFKFFSMGNGL